MSIPSDGIFYVLTHDLYIVPVNSIDLEALVKFAGYRQARDHTWCSRHQLPGYEKGDISPKHVQDLTHARTQGR